MYVYRVDLKTINERTGQRNFMNFECEHPTIAALAAELKAQGFVSGWSLRTRWSKSLYNVLEVVDAEERLLSADMIHEVKVPDYRLVRFEEGA